MKRVPTIITSVITSVVTAVLVVWFSEAFLQIVPSPQRVLLRIQNALSDVPSHTNSGFRIVLCWLENDWNGENTRNVENAFSGIEGITLVVSAEEISASGAADEWRPAMRSSAVEVLEEWNADLVIAGKVKRAGEALALWFVPRRGDGTLSRADRPYTLEEATLGSDFHEDLRTQLAVMAWSAVAPLADAGTHGHVFEKGLRSATTRLAKLLDAPTIRRSEHRAALYMALGNALYTLGTREPGSKDLERSASALHNALAILTRQRTPIEWARAQNSIGLVLSDLAERGSAKERLEQALAAYLAALEVFSREQTSFEWAALQGHLGTVLRRLGELETGIERFERAIAAHRAALEVFTREDSPYDWAFEQDHLGNALSSLGERQNDPVLLEQAILAHRAALTELTRKRVPLSWAAAQHNLGLTLIALGQRRKHTDHFEQSLDALRAALRERTRKRTPFDWALTQNALGKALFFLGERKDERRYFEQARDAYHAALEVLGGEGESRHREMVQNNLVEVSLRL